MFFCRGTDTLTHRQIFRQYSGISSHSFGRLYKLFSTWIIWHEFYKILRCKKLQKQLRLVRLHYDCCSTQIKYSKPELFDYFIPLEKYIFANKAWYSYKHCQKNIWWEFCKEYILYSSYYNSVFNCNGIESESGKDGKLGWRHTFTECRYCTPTFHGAWES